MLFGLFGGPGCGFLFCFVGGVLLVVFFVGFFLSFVGVVFVGFIRKTMCVCVCEGGGGVFC